MEEGACKLQEGCWLRDVHHDGSVISAASVNPVRGLEQSTAGKGTRGRAMVRSERHAL
jgi:hypothetical protein